MTKGSKPHQLEGELLSSGSLLVGSQKKTETNGSPVRS